MNSKSEHQESIRSERNRIRKRWLYLDKCKDKLREQEKANQKRCLHDAETTYHSDPAGGSDSWTECCICEGLVPKR